MKSLSITDGIFPIRRGRLLIPVVSMALSVSIGLIELHAQTTGGNNVPPKKDIYELQEITDTPKGATPLPIKLETYLKWLKKVNGEPESAPVDSDIQWTADKGEPIFDPSYGATVELDFGKPFVKENTDEAKKVKVTATYSGSASVENSPRTKDVKRIYLDFWIAETKESDDDVLVVRAEDAQVAEDDKKVIHWAKVLVKHSAPSVLPLQLESTGEKKLYFYGEQQDPNQLPEDPPLEETLEKEYADGEWFWIGTEEKGTGQGKFKAQADAGTGYKDAPEEKTVNLLPAEVAPEVLAVNSDFDESRIDPATGYAIPDCDDIPGVDQKTGSGNTQIALNASRAHLDGLFANDEKVTEDLHKGWFGVTPNQVGDDFWNGANVTIRKIDKIDVDTGYKESGQVRFYAKWSSGYYGITPYDFQTLQPVNLVSAGLNLRPNVGVYGASPTFPDGAEFYMEGVRPGKITLEWRLQKGSIDVKHKQTFKVETRKTLAEWREEVRYQIRLQTKVKSGTEVDVAAYHTGNGFRNTSGSQPVESDNVARVQAIYYYYQQLFKQMPEKFMWAGMAKTAAAPIYAGMSDMSSWLWATDPIPPDDDRDPGVDIFVKLLLLGGQKAIYEDKAWAHRAYLASGKWALDWVDRNSIGSKPTSFDAWSDLDVGIQESEQDLINQANHDLLQREQRDVIQTYYASYATPYFMKQPPSGFSFFGRWIEIVGAVHLTPNANGLVNTGEWLSANANKNPMPGGPKFRDIVPGGRIDNYQDRWNWTANTANGMLSIWTGEATDTSVPKFNASQRLSENNKTMYSAAAAYSYDTGGLPIE